MSQQSQSLLDVTLRLGNERETKISMKNFDSISRKDSIVSIEMKASRNFQHYSARFMEEEMGTLLTNKMADLTELQKFSMKLLPCDAEGCSIPAGHFAFAIGEFTKLKELVLVNVTLCGSACWLERTLEKHPSLETVRLVGCPLTELSTADGNPGSLSILHALATTPLLTTVSLTNVQFHSEDSLADPIAKLVQAHKKKTLRNLTLRKCAAITQEVIAALMEALKTNQRLKTLVIDPDETGLSNQSIAAIGEMLMTNTTIEDISVRLPPTGADLLPVMHALQTNRTLKIFHLLGNDSYIPTERDKDHLHRALFHNFVFHHIGRHGDRGWTQSIDFFLRLNRAGRLRLIGEENNCTREDWVDMIIQHYADLNIVYYFLSRNPSICQTIMPLNSSSSGSGGDNSSGSNNNNNQSSARNKRQRLNH